MTPKTSEQLTTLQTMVREAITQAIRPALELLREALPTGRPKHHQVLKLIGRESYLAQQEINNTLSFEQLDVARNNLRSDVLLFTERLTLNDFSTQLPTHPTLRPGHLLYRIPTTMRRRVRYECIIRIADTLELLRENLDALEEDYTVEPIGVSEVMEVELIDPSPAGEPAFDILLTSSAEQYVDRYSYTEWVFFVRALREGRHMLLAKISVLIDVGGRERRKDLLIRREVEVTVLEANSREKFVDETQFTIASVPEATAGAPIPQEVDQLPGAPPAAPGSNLESPARPRRRRTLAYLSAAATIALLITVAIFLFPTGTRDFTPTKDNVELPELPPDPTVSDSLRLDSL